MEELGILISLLAIAWLSGKVAQIVENKGHKGGKYRWMAVGLWLGGGLAGGIIGSVIELILYGGRPGAGYITAILSLVGAIIGANIAIKTANNVKPEQERQINIDSSNQ